MDKVCVYCRTTSDLNTELTITLENGERCKVYVCDVHAEDATIKSAREAYLKNQRDINELLQRLKELEFSPEPTATPAKLQIIKKVHEPTIESEPLEEAIDVEAYQTSPDQTFVDAMEFEAKTKAGTVAAPSGGVNESIHGSLAGADADALAKVRGQIPESAIRGFVKPEVVAIRGGNQQVVIPAEKVDGFGTLSIRITPGISDADIQKKFKQAAARSIEDDFSGIANHDNHRCDLLGFVAVHTVTDVCVAV
jgi:hypothetical protein